ncbi:hypothetical protein [Mycoplasma sp. SG1]|uniref:hypothetical protein n=1 Tax=Mycoplasma sp. SG1 TaxID=2810348 RepID=UPI0020241857|nr:hypothetical protein [Mycoplasma sp. SG1]URM52979.1 hypothetical protein JRW51_01375 [Mycoplasma sp. SG1]
MKKYHILRKIRNSFIIKSKFKIFLTAFLIFISSVLILFSLLIPSSLQQYSSGMLNELNPYKSYVDYDTNPWNSPTFNYGGEDGEDKVPDPLTSPSKRYSTYGWYNPNDETSFKNRNPINDSSLAVASYFAYLSGLAINNNYIDQLNNIKDPLLVPIVCNMMGDNNPDDIKKGVGACIKHVITSNAPYFVRQKMNNKNFALTFGLTPFDKKSDEHIVNIPFYLNKLNVSLWGVNSQTTRLNSTIKNTLNSDWINDQTANYDRFAENSTSVFTNNLPVVINKAAAKLLNLKTGDLKRFNYSYYQIQVKNGDNKWDPAEPSQFKANIKTATGIFVHLQTNQEILEHVSIHMLPISQPTDIRVNPLLKWFTKVIWEFKKLTKMLNIA